MDAGKVLSSLMRAIDEHRWNDLEQYLHPEFRCRLIHTGETFDRDSWIQFNADYPGFDGLTVEELVAAGDRAACRSHVTGRGDGGIEHFECASFASLRDGLIYELNEVWTDLGQVALPGTRSGAD